METQATNMSKFAPLLIGLLASPTLLTTNDGIPEPTIIAGYTEIGNLFNFEQSGVPILVTQDLENYLKLKRFAVNFVQNSVDLTDEYWNVVNKNFWDMI